MTAIFSKAEKDGIIDNLTKDLKALKKNKKNLITWHHFLEVSSIPTAGYGMPAGLKHTGAQTYIIRINGGDRKQEREFINSGK
jgi:hypothetical protein